MLGRKAGNRGALAGALIATLPDLDVVLLPFYSPLQQISIHRGYSHSVIFGLIAGLLIAFLLSRWRPFRGIPVPRLVLFAWLALLTHMLLDSFTTYGTQLFLPFSDIRVSFDSITIVDPVYTLPLLAGLILALTVFRDRAAKRAASNYAGLAISTAYLAFTLWNKSNVEQAFRDSLDRKDVAYNELRTIPVSAGGLRWYGGGMGDSLLHLGDHNLLRRDKIAFTPFPIRRKLLRELDPYLADRLTWFAKDFYTVARTDSTIRFYNLQVDMQGIREVDGYTAPTAFYFEITPREDGTYSLKSRQHRK